MQLAQKIIEAATQAIISLPSHIYMCIHYIYVLYNTGTRLTETYQDFLKLRGKEKKILETSENSYIIKIKYCRILVL